MSTFPFPMAHATVAGLEPVFVFKAFGFGGRT
jgi:hypothetical protein